jgi:hypothetical protein
MQTPSKVGRFGLQNEIGSSPTSSVSKAWDESLNCEVVVKVVQSNDERFAYRALRDVERFKGVGLPGIQRVLEVGREDSYVWYAAEPAGNRSLQDEFDARAKSGAKLDEKTIYQVGRKLAAALEQLHNLRIVHGNLKATNVLGALDGDLQLTDAGLLRALDETEIGTWIGPVREYRHMTPDQLMGLKPLDERSDIYQLGLILYELATLTHPCAKAENAAAVRDRMQNALPAPEKVAAGFDKKLSAAIMKCLARDREQRFPSIKEFMRAWSGVTAKYQSLSDLPPPTATGGSGGIRKTGRFEDMPPMAGPRVSGPSKRQPMLNDPRIREIKPTPAWVMPVAILVLGAIVAAGGIYFYKREAVVRLDGTVSQEPGFGGTRLTYRTNYAVPSAVRVAGRTFKNAKVAEAQKHEVLVTDLAAGKTYEAQVELGGESLAPPIPLTAPDPRPIQGVRIKSREDGLAISFRTSVKARSKVKATIAGQPAEVVGAAEPDVSHDVVLKGATAARTASLVFEATDRDGITKTIEGGALAAQVVQPLARAVTQPPFASGPLADPVPAIEKAGLAEMIGEMSALGPWFFESPDVSSGARSEAYRALTAFELALTRATGLPTELAAFNTVQEDPHYRGQILAISEVARLCAGLSRTPPQTPGTLIATLGLFTKLKPGIFASQAAKTRVAYDPHPTPGEIGPGTKATIRLPTPPQGEYTTALLVIAVSSVPRDAALIVTSSTEPKEFVLYSPAVRPAPFPGEQFVARELPASLAAAGPLELTIRMEPIGGAKPAPVRAVGGLLVYR